MTNRASDKPASAQAAPEDDPQEPDARQRIRRDISKPEGEYGDGREACPSGPKGTPTKD